MLSYIINQTGATILVDDKTFTIRKDHINYDAILDALGNKDETRILDLVDIPESVKKFTQGKVEVNDGGIFFNGEEIHTGLANRILNLIRDGYQGLAEPLVAFLENLMENPSRRAVQGLYEWLEKSDLPITEDGCFIAWKIVGPDFMSLYSGSGAQKFDNSPGKVVETPRNQVDEDPTRTCSHGLHFCSTGYLPHYGRAQGNKVVMVKVNPRDVVAFPNDYNTAKGRACRYEVVREVSREAAPTCFEGESGIINTEEKFEAIGFYSSEGKVVLFDVNSQEKKTGLDENGDYYIEQIDGGGVKLMPSGREVRL